MPVFQATYPKDSLVGSVITLLPWSPFGCNWKVRSMSVFNLGARPIDRRAALLGGASVGLALAAPALIGRAHAADDTIRILGVETAALDDWTPFTKETGLKVEFTGITADAGVYRREVVANAAGENYDIFIMNGGLADTFGPEYLLRLDGTKIPSWSMVSEGVRSSSLIRSKAGELYAVPAITNADSFAFFPSEIASPEPLSWATLFENDKLKGKVAVEDNWATTMIMAAVYLKIAKGMAIAEPSNMSPEEAKGVADFLVARKKAGQFRALWTSFDESVDLLARKEVLAAGAWEPAVKVLQKKGLDVRYAYAKEGYLKWMIACYAAKQVADRGMTEKVYRAMGGFIGGAYAARIAVLRGYSTGRPSAGLDFAKQNGFPAIDIDTIEANVKKIDEKFVSKLAWTNVAPDHLDKIEAEWDRFRQA